MKINKIRYEVVLSEKKSLEEVNLLFKICDGSNHNISGAIFLYMNEYGNEPEDVLFFDFCENISNDTNILKEISYNFSDTIDFQEYYHPTEESTKAKSLELERINNVSISKETDYEKATTLINKYFKIFDTNLIDKKNWENFSKYFGLNVITPNIENVIYEDKKTIIHDGLKNYKDLIDGKTFKKNIDDFASVLSNSNYTAQKTYECSNSKEIISVVINNLFLVKPNIVIKKCENCGKLFIPQYSGANGCLRISDENKKMTCIEIINYRKRLERNKTELCRNLYNKIYQRTKKSISRGYGNIDAKNKFLKMFMKKGNEYRAKKKKGFDVENEFYSWLLEMDKIGVITDD